MATDTTLPRPQGRAPAETTAGEARVHAPFASGGRGLERLCLVAALAGVLWAAASLSDSLTGTEGLPQRARLTADLARIERENEVLAQRVLGLQRDIVAQNDRDEVQEALVRDVLGYVRPKELILQPRPEPRSSQPKRSLAGR